MTSRGAVAEDNSSLILDGREHNYALSVLCGEIAHELSAPLLFLRDIAAHGQLDAEDRESATEQIARLEALMLPLRRARVHPPAMVPVRLSEAVNRAVGRVRKVGVWNVVVAGPSNELAEVHVLATQWMLDLMLVSLLRPSGAAERTDQPVQVTTLLDKSSVELTVHHPCRGEHVVPRGLAGLGAAGEGIPRLLAAQVARSHGWAFRIAHDGQTAAFQVCMSRAETGNT